MTAKKIESLLPDFMDVNDIRYAGWTEGMWAKHDAEVRRKIDNAEVPEHALPVVDWRARGFSVRAIAALRTADHSKPALKLMHDWHDEHPREGILVLSGKPGCGKTVAATWWGMQAMALCVRSADFAADSRYDAETRQRWLTASAVMFDDLGAEYADAKGSFSVDFADLIDKHYSNCDRVVITTNCSVADFKKRYGERVTDRIRECGDFLSVDAESLRSQL